jgi:hypothetical protein
MPGSIWFPFRQGNRSEYLALYILSSLGIAVYVPRTEDIGADFYCSLAKRDGNRMTFHLPFIVQVKSSSIEKIPFGGPDEHGRWRKEEIEWLFTQELPLLVGIADKGSSKLDLYSTSNMWAARYAGGHFGEIVLLPGTQGDLHGALMPAYTNMVDWPQGIGDGRKCDLPLGPPILSISIDDVENETRMEEYREILASPLRMEQDNIAYRHLQVHFYRCLHRFSTNKPVEGEIFYCVGNPVPGTNTAEQLESIKPIIATLALNYKIQNQKENLMRLKPIVQLLPQDELMNMVKRDVPELFETPSLQQDD